MKSELAKLKAWPMGMKLLVGWTILDLIVGTGQFLYWAFVTNEFFPRITLQGSYALVGYAAVLVSVVSVLTLRRRLFVVSNLIASIVHMFVTFHYNAEIASDLAGRLQSYNGLMGIDQTTIYLGWNSFVGLAWALVFWYLIRFEIVIRSDDSMPLQQAS